MFIICVLCFVGGISAMVLHDIVVEDDGKDSSMAAAWSLVSMALCILCGGLFVGWILHERHIDGQYVVKSISKYENKYVVEIDMYTYLYQDSCKYKVGDTLYIKK